MAKALQPHPDRLFPADPGVRRVARRLYESINQLPVISPHGHVPAYWLSEDTPFGDPTSLLLTPDHYVTRLLHAHGVRLEELGVGERHLDPASARAAFRLLCARWPIYRGTPVKYWFESTLSEVFGIEVCPSGETADEIYDAIDSKLKELSFRPRALFDRFNIELLATTDDPCDDLTAHRVLREDTSFHGRVIPTFRPDTYLEAGGPGWNVAVDRLAQASGTDTGTLAGWLTAMRNRRDYFIDHGAVSADHSHPDADMHPLDRVEAERIYARARSGQADARDAVALRRHLLHQMAAMSADDGLVMTLHPAVYRNHHRPTFQRFGADVGCDIPTGVEFTRALEPVLTRFGTSPRFQLVLFTLDETTFSREIAPLAGFYPGVYAGAPWWFLDAPEAIRRYRAAITETAGFSKTSGFIDDTRAFCSIPARHDMSRRLDAGFLATLVAEHRLDEGEAAETLQDLVTTNPRRAFKL